MKTAVRQNLPLFITAGILVLLFTTASLIYTGFCSPNVVVNLLADNAFLGISAVGMTLVIFAGLGVLYLAKTAGQLPAFLPGLPVGPLLDAKIYSVRLGVCKPDPRIYLAACRELDVSPSECLYVGDGGSHELTGAALL